MLKINDDTNRLTKDELEDYRINSGITSLQYEIIKRRYYDATEPTVINICMELNINERKFNRELNKALKQIFKYTQNQRK